MNLSGPWGAEALMRGARPRGAGLVRTALLGLAGARAAAGPPCVRYVDGSRVAMPECPSARVCRVNWCRSSGHEFSDSLPPGVTARGCRCPSSPTPWATRAETFRPCATRSPSLTRGSPQPWRARDAATELGHASLGDGIGEFTTKWAFFPSCGHGPPRIPFRHGGVS